MMKKLRHRYRKWKEWRRYTGLNKFRQICVLLGVDNNTHFNLFKTRK